MDNDDEKDSPEPLGSVNTSNGPNTSDSSPTGLPVSRRRQNTAKLFRTKKRHPKQPDFDGSACIDSIEYSAECWNNGDWLRLEFNPRRRVEPAPPVPLRDRILAVCEGTSKPPNPANPPMTEWTVRHLQQELHVVAVVVKAELRKMHDEHDDIVYLKTDRRDSVKFRLVTWADRFERLMKELCAACEAAAFHKMVGESGLFDENVAPAVSAVPRRSRVSWRS